MTGTRSSKPEAKSHLRAFVVATLLVILLPAMLIAFTVMVALPESCGCAATPTHGPNWTPTPRLPISADEAAARASRFAGSSMQPDPNWALISGRFIYQPSGDGAFGFVDGISGTVIEVVLEKQLPDSDTASASADAALGTAEAFLSRGGVTADGLAAQAQFVHGASVAYYDVTWSAPGADKIALDVRVNASSGAVFAYRDLRSGIELTAPIVGRAAAIQLAQASTYASGETPDAPEMQSPDLQAYADSWMWMVGFPDGVLYVNAVTGEVSVAKWSSR
jgi:hypothetical protein